MSGVYPGESPDKRAARMWLYRHALRAPRAGAAIALAGTEPLAEVELLRDYLAWPGSRTWIVDWAKNQETRQAVMAALAQASAAWPAANVCRVDLGELLPTLPGIGFANLDFMGQMDRKNMQPCIRSAIARMLPGGVLAVTWFRGRERRVENHSSWDVFEAAKRATPAMLASMNDERWVGVQRLVDEWAAESGVTLALVGALEYQHRHSPMSVTVWQRQA